MRQLLNSIAVVTLMLCARSVVGADAGHAFDAGDDAGAVETDAAADAAAVDDTAVLALEGVTRQVGDLIAGRLDPGTDPEALFNVSLADEAAIEVDAQRLRALLRDVDGAAHRTSRSAHPRPVADDAGIADGGVDPALWHARIDLDRARLVFYELPLDRRAEILSAHALAQIDAEAPPSAAELREREADRQRQTALDAAQTARTDAERFVSTELARLLRVERAQAALEDDFARQEKEIEEQREITIGWRQRALETHGKDGPSADRTYEELRGALRRARDALSKALDELAGAASNVPVAGPDPLGDLRVEVDTTAARAERHRVDVDARRLQADEEGIRRERAAQLFDEIDTLNGERLGLLGALSPAKRRAVTGFATAGWDQASSEARQLTLILRYHRYVIGEWVSAFRHPTRSWESALTGGAVPIIEWIAALAAFVWWRRRSTALLRIMHRRAEEADRRARPPTPSPATRALAFVSEVHRPVEWLALLFVLRWFLPASTQELLEVRVASVLMTWTFGAALAVDVVNAFAGTGRSHGEKAHGPDSAVVRLRSLRLVARVIVTFGLILVISSMLVGRGTIYQWVFSTCWLASIPVLLVLVHWWRPIVFRRTARVRKPARIQRWVLANSQRWGTSFVAAAIGGLYLLVGGAARRLRNWVGRFVITRRALAYLFRRQLGKREQTTLVERLPDAVFKALGPENPSAAWIANDSEGDIDQLARRIRERGGGVIGIVGERGMGKSASLRRLRGDGADTILFDSPLGGLDTLRIHLAERLALPRATEFEHVAGALAASPTTHALLIDGAQHFVQPVMGGLAAFDILLATASRHTRTTTWVFALDQVIWPFLERARGARPLFDEVIRLDSWREEQIVSLLQARTGEVGLSPSFEPLLERLPATADDVDKQEALAARAADYYRLLWDAAMGNPGLALHLWRRSLGVDSSGKATVRPIPALDTADLERLPDSSAFVLRAVLQLAPASADHIAGGTMIRAAEVADALRYAASRGYIEEHDGGYRVTWTWFRAISLFLQRKHLLIAR